MPTPNPNYQFPPPVKSQTDGPFIFSADGTLPTNLSGISYNAQRWQDNPPPPFVETEEWAAESSADDERETRTFLTPWSEREALRAWLLGYSTSRGEDPNNPSQPPYVISRVLPDQHPLKPWLYCTSAKITGKGTWVQDSLSPPVPATNSDGKQLHAPMVAFAEGNAALGFGGDGVAALKCTYEPLPYDVRPDSEAQASKFGELTRFVQREDKAAVQSLPFYKIASAGSNNSNAAALALNAVAQALSTAANAAGATTAAVVSAGNAAAAGSPLAAAVAQAGAAAVAANQQPKDAQISIGAAANLAAVAIFSAANGEVLAFSAGPFQGAPIPEAGVLLMPTKEITYTLHQWPDRNLPVWDAAVGRINSDLFDGSATGYPAYQPGTLLFLTYETERRRNVVGRVVWKIIFRFMYRQQGWNSYPAPDGNLYPATFGGQPNGPTVYQSATFGGGAGGAAGATPNLFSVTTPAVYQQLAG